MNENEMNMENAAVETPQTEEVLVPAAEVSEAAVAAEEVAEEVAEAEVVEEAAVEETSVEEVPAPEAVEEETAVVAAEAVVKRMGLSKKAMIIGAAAIALVVVVALVASLLLGSPLALVGKGVANSMEAIAKNESVTFVSGVLNGGSTEISCDLAELMENTVGYSMFSGKASVKLFTDLKGNAAAVSADVQLDGADPMDASLVANKDRIAVKSGWLLGDTAYGVDLKKLADNFNDSEFGPYGEYSLGFELDEDLMTLAENMDDLTADSKKLTTAAVTELLKAIQKNADISKKNTTLSLGDGEEKVTAVTIEMDYEQICTVAKQMLEYIRTDKKVEEYLSNYIQYILSASYGYMVDEDEAEEAFYAFYEELDYAWEEGLDELEEMLEESDVYLNVTLLVSKSNKQLIGMELKAEADGEQVKGYVYAGPDLKNLEEIKFRLNMAGDTVHGSYMVQTNDNKQFEAKLKFVDTNDDKISGTISWDKKIGEFEAELDVWGDVYGVNGDLKKSGKALSFGLDSVYGDGENIDLGVDVTFATGDKMPSVTKFTDILTMEVYEFEELIADIQLVVEDMMYLFY